MKKLLLIALLCLSAPAWAEEGMMKREGGPGMEGGKDMMEKNFAEHKSKVLGHLNEHIAKLEKARACAQAAQDPQALHACKPEGGPKGGPGQGMGGKHGGGEGMMKREGGPQGGGQN